MQLWSYIRSVFGSSGKGSVSLYNTETKQLERFRARGCNPVTIYTCGPTVYNRLTIGNLRAYVFADTLNRTLRSQQYAVEHVINITDVGHLTDDADDGEDKIEKQASAKNLTAAEIAESYTDYFLRDIAALNVPLDNYAFPRATEYIEAQIGLIQELEAKGHTYVIDDGVYFDTSTFPEYGKLGGLNLNTETQARVASNPQKKNPQDFALWKLSSPTESRQQEWDSPWGVGYPGWHIECSAMSRTLLGQPLDIHTGGIDHATTHHNNEIAQSEGAYGAPYARYWMHNAFLTIEGNRIGKSMGNAITIPDVIERNIDPRALRYLYLEAHYRKPQSFSWEALEAAETALSRLITLYTNLPHGTTQHAASIKAFNAAITDDLNMPQALAVTWEVAKDEAITHEEKQATLTYFDTVLGLNLSSPITQDDPIPSEIQQKAQERETLRKQGVYNAADMLRDEIAAAGYEIRDTSDGITILKK